MIKLDYLGFYQNIVKVNILFLVLLEKKQNRNNFDKGNLCLLMKY